jgi:hypothetical protein
VRRLNTRVCFSLCLTGMWTAQFAAEPISRVEVDPRIEVTSGHRISRVLLAVGEQAYKCQSDTKGGFVWGPSSIPSATLYDPWNYKVGEHGFDGKLPFWKAADGEVTAKRVNGVPSGDKQSIDWLLLQTDAATGSLANVRFIQRLYTGGGKAPSNGCDAKVAAKGEAVRVPYTAAYYLWEKKY